MRFRFPIAFILFQIIAMTRIADMSRKSNSRTLGFWNDSICHPFLGSRILAIFWTLFQKFDSCGGLLSKQLFGIHKVHVLLCGLNKLSQNSVGQIA